MKIHLIAAMAIIGAMGVRLAPEQRDDQGGHIVGNP